MTSARNTILIIVVCTSITAAVAENACAQGAARQPDQKVLTFCALPSAEPRVWRDADGSLHGLDVAVAKLLCKRLGRKFEIHWCSSVACSRRCLREGRCDVVIGLPHDPQLWQEAAWSVPYAGSQFGVVVPPGTKDVHSLADLRGKRIGVVTGTVPLSEKDHVVLRFKTRQDALNGFHKSKLDAAFMDADFAQWFVHKHLKLKLRQAPQFVTQKRWNMAMAVRAKDANLLIAINGALSQLMQTGLIRKAYANLGVTYRAPFTNAAPRSVKYNAWKRIREQGRLVVSMDPANLPYSSAKKTTPGLDVEIARALADELGVKLELEWIDVSRETAIGHLLEYECDLALGAAVDPNAVEDEEPLAGKVIYSQPYYGTGYVLVNRNKGPRVKSLLELKGAKSRRLGTEAGSVADYNLRQKGYLRRLYRNQLAVLNDLNEGGIDYGYLWANVGWTLHNSPDFKLELTPHFVPEDRWNIAVAMRTGDDELKKHVDKAIVKLIKKGRVAKALARYHVPFFPPFEKVEKKTNTGVIRHDVIDRGLEPRFSQKSTSKKPYGGLARVRSAGVLIVGLDQKNLPFSTAHPKPAGLDYEIAGLLAKELGVSLQVYWAYSSHDSYPSKLAKRKLCDVILGVMPDDRFARRVIYSNPYYVAKFQFVVPANTVGAPNVKSPLAVEPGVAALGIRDRKVLAYPNLESILDAVAGGKVKTGYVISTRGGYLAETRWKGKLRFADGPYESDRFPICAAVRKTDADLKEAIDFAFIRLEKSGRLAGVLARWHIPYSPADKGAVKSK